MHPPDLLLQRCLEELEQQESLPWGGRVVVEREDHRLHELSGLVLGHLEDEPGQVHGLRLQG